MLYDEGSFGRHSCRADRKNKGTRSKRKNNRWKAADGEFRCTHCKQMVFTATAMGTVHRNHCPHCLHSVHVDTKPGNRASTCQSRMIPVGLTIKHNGFDKYGKARCGDVMLVHHCSGCGAVNINRIAGDVSCDRIIDVFEGSLSMDHAQKATIETKGIIPTAFNSDLLEPIFSYLLNG
ncbi:RNHCP domain-containing protein [Cohaesibacter sp. ES.047]|uniref:RNHCP domain-containing protein n=1 Tax=Cohaesibacter sp. ES.047 TaxID=1798205 RepID=UPI0012FDCD1A|nr:RNHCP domain-containing protein [Cohaesibacter sp. ES.047]